MARIEQVWFKREATTNGRGNFEIAEDCGLKRIVVELDPDITANLPVEDRRSAIVAMHDRIQRAARHRYEADGAYPVYHPYSDRLKHHSIALTAFDLAEA